MLENFIFSANAVLPIFLVIAFGYVLRRKNFLTPVAVAEMNRIVFVFALPFLLFRNTYQADFNTLFDPRFIVWILVSTLANFSLIWIFAEIYLRKNSDLIGAFVQASFRANYAIVGIPLVANIMGENDTGLASLAAAFVVTSFNILSVIVLTAKNEQSGKLNLKLVVNMLVSVCKNPSIIAITCGIVFNLINLPIPYILWTGVNYMAILCTPMALIAAGASIKVAEMMVHIRPAIVASALKIAVMPTIFVTISVLLGFRGEPLAVIFAVFANPTAIMSYVMADRMNGNTAVTSAIILITTVFSSIALTIGVYLLRMFELV